MQFAYYDEKGLSSQYLKIIILFQTRADWK